MSALEELKNLLDGSHGEAIDVPHPNQHKKIETTPFTKWHRSELPSDFEKNQMGAVLYVEDPDRDDFGKPKTFVKGQIIQQITLDEYNEPVGEPIYAVMTKVDNPELRIKDISSSLIRPFTAKELRRRFPAAFAEFEIILKQKGVPLPIALLDEVPPHIVQMLMAKGVRAVSDFAGFSKKQMDEMKSSLEAAKLTARVPYLPKYLEAAKAKAGNVIAEAA